MISLDDEQLRDVMEVASMLEPVLRDAFLQTLAEELEGKQLGEGLVHRADRRPAPAS